jgi:hypothetical protein
MLVSGFFIARKILLTLRPSPTSLHAVSNPEFWLFGINHFAIPLKFCAVAANMNSSCAPTKPRRRNLPLGCVAQAETARKARGIPLAYI